MFKTARYVEQNKENKFPVTSSIIDHRQRPITARVAFTLLSLPLVVVSSTYYHGMTGNLRYRLNLNHLLTQGKAKAPALSLGYLK